MRSVWFLSDMDGRAESDVGVLFVACPTVTGPADRLVGTGGLWWRGRSLRLRPRPPGLGWNRDRCRCSRLHQSDGRGRAHQRRFADTCVVLGSRSLLQEDHHAVVVSLVEYLGGDQDALPGGDTLRNINLY